MERNMANGLSTEISVRRRVKDGWHVYTCDSMPGLYVAHRDDKVAYEDVPVAIRKLIRLDHGVDCVVSHVLEYRDFIHRMRLAEAARDNVKARTDAMVNGEGNEYFRFSVQPSKHQLHDIPAG